MSTPLIHPTAIVDSSLVGPGTRIWAFVHVLAGARIGANCNVADRVFVEGGARIGNNVTIKNNVCVWDGITIEDDVFVGPNVTFTNDCYPRSPRMPEARARYADVENWRVPTLLERGCAIGANAAILPGLTVGRYSMVGAGAVVTRNVDSFALVVGSPARQVDCVCRCGRPLRGCYTVRTCAECGETPAERASSSMAPLAAIHKHTP